MSRLAAFGIATALALAVLLGSAVAQSRQHRVASEAPSLSHSMNETDLGRCRIRYDGLAMDQQPAQMECEHANWIAHRWGGRVMQQTGRGLVEVANYRGSNDFTGVPSTELPNRGYCRAWIPGAAPSQQPAQSDCRAARRTAEARGGRVLYMPL